MPATPGSGTVADRTRVPAALVFVGDTVIATRRTNGDLQIAGKISVLAAKRVASGRYKSGWIRLAKAPIARDRACQNWGATDDLTAHLDPAFAGDHNSRPADDLTTLCRRCHGRIDGRRAHTRHAGG